MAASTLVAAPGSAGEVDVQGVLAVRGVWVRGQETWLRGGFGRLTEGAAGPADGRVALRAPIHLGLDWTPAETWRVHVHGALHVEPSDYGGRRGGLAEAFVQYRPELTQKLALRLRAGLLFPQTSLENVGSLWQSPYTLTLSALNTWTAEEQRLTGIEGGVAWRGEQGGGLELAGTVFGGNDSSGALLAWRGWTLGDRLTTGAELLPLPPLSTLRPGGGFAAQRSGTRPIEELDGRAGWQLRGRWSAAGGSELRVAWLDNRGDRELHRGQYAWATTVFTAGAELRLGGGARVVAEAADGRTGMGSRVPDHRPHVDVHFRAGYVLLSLGSGRWRGSVRVDAFDNRDLDGTEEPGDESGWAWTVAAFWHPAETLRLGVELVDLRADRPAAAFSGADADTDGQRALVELRLAF